jgi:2-dehydro-3-deoxy-D-gluconate 5-dehydrogenase
MDSRQPLEGRCALVTGASQGIGQAVALRLARQGCDLGLVQRGEAAATTQAITALGRRAEVVRADLAAAEQGEAAVAAVAERLGRLDIVVCNAATTHRQPALEVPLQDWRRVIEVNLTSVFAVARAAARIFLTQGGGGSIVTIASVLSFQGGINVVAYAASKGGVAQLTKALANEWAPLSIRVNAVCPGYVANQQTAPLRADPGRYAEISARIPAGRWADDDDIAGAVAFLVSPDAAYVHGSVLVVDGGWLAR